MGDAGQRMGYGKSSVRRALRRSFRSGHGGLMFNRRPVHGIPDTPVRPQPLPFQLNPQSPGFRAIDAHRRLTLSYEPPEY
jgi:hypothetical protein